MCISKDCIHCKKCTKNCSFLEKYDIDLSQFEQRQDLAYNCFMCGKCKIVCPKDIDGREIALKHRQDEVNASGKIAQKGYSLLLLEKKNYLFKNYKNTNGKKSCLFTGCNFLSYTPNTAKKLIEICKDNEIGIIFDCCGKPVYELGLEKDGQNIIDKLQSKFKKEGIEEIITVCPNCYHYLKDKLDVAVIDVYTKLGNMNLLTPIEGEYDVFRPCSDRENNELFDLIQKQNPALIMNKLNEQCCGAGGCASVKEPEIAIKMRHDAINQSDNIIAYCSTCYGFITQSGGNITHFLTEMLGVKEKKKTNSLLNRMKYMQAINKID